MLVFAGVCKWVGKGEMNTKRDYAQLSDAYHFITRFYNSHLDPKLDSL
jgi:hypothetical protein